MSGTPLFSRPTRLLRLAAYGERITCPHPNLSNAPRLCGGIGAVAVSLPRAPVPGNPTTT
jgi:hypothetical protein